MFLPGIYRIEKNLNFCFTLTVVLIYSETNTTECIISFLKNICFIFICMGILTAYMCLVHCVCAWCPGKPKEGAGSTGTGVTDVSELPCGCRFLLKSRQHS